MSEKASIELGPQDAALVVRGGEYGVCKMELVFPKEEDDPDRAIDPATIVVLTAAYLMKDMEVESMEKLLEKVFDDIEADGSVG